MNRRWLPAALLCAIVYYAVVGVGFAALAAQASSHRMRTVWRLAAWLVCAVTFAAHVGWEHLRRKNPPTRGALHAAVAVGLGAFLLAAHINVFARPGTPRPRLLLALVVFPLVTAVPAFLAALAGTAVLGRRAR